MEETRANGRIQYNLTPINEMINECGSPAILRHEIATLAFNYAMSFDGDMAEDFRHDMGVLRMLYDSVGEVV